MFSSDDVTDEVGDVINILEAGDITDEWWVGVVISTLECGNFKVARRVGVFNKSIELGDAKGLFEACGITDEGWVGVVMGALECCDFKVAPRVGVFNRALELGDATEVFKANGITDDGWFGVVMGALEWGDFKVAPPVGVFNTLFELDAKGIFEASGITDKRWVSGVIDAFKCGDFKVGWRVGVFIIFKRAFELGVATGTFEVMGGFDFEVAWRDGDKINEFWVSGDLWIGKAVFIMKVFEVEAWAVGDATVGFDSNAGGEFINAVGLGCDIIWDVEVDDVKVAGNFIKVGDLNETRRVCKWPGIYQNTANYFSDSNWFGAKQIIKLLIRKA